MSPCVVSYSITENRNTQKHIVDQHYIEMKFFISSYCIWGRVIKIPLGILIMWIVLNKIPLLLIYCFKQEIHWIGSQKRLIRSRFLSIPLNKIRILIPLFPLNEISKDNWITWINRQIWNVNQILNKTPQFHFHICLKIRSRFRMNKIPLSIE